MAPIERASLPQPSPPVEEMLRRRERELQTLVEQAPDVISRLDRHYRYLYINPAAEAMLGRPASEVVGRTNEELGIPEDLVERWHTALARVWSEGCETTLECQVPTPRGVRTFQSRIAPEKGAHGEVASVFVIARDVTEIKLAEEERGRLAEQLRQVQKMEAVGRLAGGIAHDFNNLLTVIQGHCRLLLDALAADDPRRGNAAEIDQAARRAAGLTRQLLAYGRKQVLQLRVLDLNRVVREMEGILRRVIGEHIDLVTELQADLSPVRADPSQIEQVILNLAVNARDSMRQGGTLTLSTSTVDGPGPLAGFVLLSVADTGGGISEEVQKRIFEPFFSTKEDGSGLGLATVYGIVEQSGGRTAVESSPGRGATFRVWLPRTAEPLPGEAAVEAGAADLRGSETVLLVEDEDAVRRLVAEILEDYGYRVLTAASGDEALERLGNGAPDVDLMLSDVVMPRMSGLELAARVRRERPELRVLFISGYSRDTVAHEGALDGELVLLEKPFCPEDLARRVREVLDAPG